MKVTLCAFADEAAKDLSGQIDALKKNDIPLLELRGIDGKNVMDLTPDEARQYKAAFDEAGIAVWSLGAPLAKAVDGAKNFVYESIRLSYYIGRRCGVLGMPRKED